MRKDYSYALYNSLRFISQKQPSVTRYSTE